jgi:hypothetical protein
MKKEEKSKAGYMKPEGRHTNKKKLRPRKDA